MRVLVLALALIACMPGESIALEFATPLPELVGTFDVPRPATKDLLFNFGREFVSIENVWIEIEATATAFEYDDCGDQAMPIDPCLRVVGLPNLIAIIDEEDRPFRGLITSRRISFSDDPTAPQATRITTALFENSNPFGWEILLDGQGTVLVRFNSIFPTIESPSFRNIVLPTLEIASARMIIEGTPVPEPGTAVLTGLGLTMLASGTRAGRRRDR